jgi:hypothetical protein
MASLQCAIVLCDEHWAAQCGAGAGAAPSSEDVLRLDALVMAVQVGPGKVGGLG